MRDFLTLPRYVEEANFVLGCSSKLFYMVLRSRLRCVLVVRVRVTDTVTDTVRSKLCDALQLRAVPHGP